MDHLKQASEADFEKSAELLERIRQENPEHWPYGLSPNHFAPGNLWLIRKSASSVPVGFVGWQERKLGIYKVGFYSVGVLPEYRRQGLATQELSRLIQEKSAGVDMVRALVVDGNTASEKLASRLGIPIFREAEAKQASVGALARILRNPWTARASTVLGGAGGAVLNDQWFYSGSDTPIGSRVSDGLITAVFMAMMGRKLGLAGRAHAAGNTALRGTLMSGALKNLGVAAVPTMVNRTLRNQERGLRLQERAQQGFQDIAGKVEGGLKDLASAARERAPSLVSGDQPKDLMAPAALLAGALMLGGYGVSKAIRDKTDAPVNVKVDQNHGGRLRVTLPTKNPRDAETVLELPFDKDVNLSPALQRRLAIDTRRRLRSETSSRVARNNEIPKIFSVA